MVRPRVFAVLRLMTSSHLVGCSTCRSAGLLLFRDELSGFLRTMDRPGHEHEKFGGEITMGRCPSPPRSCSSARGLSDSRCVLRAGGVRSSSRSARRQPRNSSQVSSPACVVSVSEKRDVGFEPGDGRGRATAGRLRAGTEATRAPAPSWPP
jgi:hypothetical protein